MAFTASPQQMQILKQAVDDYCRENAIVDGNERLYVAEVVSSLFETGVVSRHDLKRGLDLAIGRLGRNSATTAPRVPRVGG